VQECIGLVRGNATSIFPPPGVSVAPLLSLSQHRKREKRRKLEGDRTKLRSVTKAAYWLPDGYTLDESDPDLLVVRHCDGAFVAAFSARGATREGILESLRDYYHQRRA
jgi:hypothetical protein